MTRSKFKEVVEKGVVSLQVEQLRSLQTCAGSHSPVVPLR